MKLVHACLVQLFVFLSGSAIAATCCPDPVAQEQGEIVCTCSNSNNWLEELFPTFTLGPTLSYTFGSKYQPGTWSLGFEAGFWDLGYIYEEPVALVGIDFGLEYRFTEAFWRYYGDVQTSMLLFGASAGASWDERYGHAWQGYAWGSLFVGGGLQTRYFVDQPEWQFSLNSMAKVPVPLILFEEFSD